MKEIIKRIKERSEWYKYLKKYKKIMIFGAKDNAHITYLLVKRAIADIDCYIVTQRADNPLQLDEKPVKILDEISEEDKQTALIIISLIYENNDNIKKELFCHGFKNIIPSAIQKTCIYTDDLQKYCKSILGNMRLTMDFCNYKTPKSIENVCIYAVTSKGNTHNSIRSYESNYIKYIFAGDICPDNYIEYTLRDNTGDNISTLNLYFCELTAGYWIYKNDKQNDYVGLYHYSRGLDITDEQIEHIVNTNIDIVLPIPYIYRYGMIAQYMEGFEDILEAICKISPEYLEPAELYFSEKLFFCGNILFSKKHIFCEYYEWMFKILKDCEKIRRLKKKEILPRIWGYYGEHLTNIFFLKHIKEYNIVYSNIKYL